MTLGYGKIGAMARTALNKVGLGRENGIRMWKTLVRRKPS